MGVEFFSSIFLDPQPKKERKMAQSTEIEIIRAEIHELRNKVYDLAVSYTHLTLPTIYSV